MEPATNLQTMTEPYDLFCTTDYATVLLRLPGISNDFHGGNTGSNPVGDASLEPTTSSLSLENS